MSYGSYVYTTDTGVDYAVEVPTDFATALSMVAATTQSPLPAEVSPRFANFDAPNITSRQVVVQSRSKLAGLLGTSYTIAGVTYTCTTAQGESIPAFNRSVLNGPFLLAGPAGPQGAQGPPGPSGPGFFRSAEQTITSGATITIAHGLSSLPNFAACMLVCKTAEGPFSVGDNLVGVTFYEGSEGTHGVDLVVTATNIVARFSVSTNVFAYFSHANGTIAYLTNSNWKAVFVAGG